MSFENSCCVPSGGEAHWKCCGSQWVMGLNPKRKVFVSAGQDHHHEISGLLKIAVREKEREKSRLAL